MGEFRIPAELIDTHEWMADSLIDDVPGINCLLIYPNKQEECDNCILDHATGRSSGIFKTGGPISFANFQICPRCNGDGHYSSPITSIIRLRVYWEAKSFIDIGAKIANPDGVVMLIGYMEDLPELERADKIQIQEYIYTRQGEAVPHGLRRDRYFIQYAKRTGS